MNGTITGRPGTMDLKMTISNCHPTSATQPIAAAAAATISTIAFEGERKGFIFWKKDGTKYSAIVTVRTCDRVGAAAN